MKLILKKARFEAFILLILVPFLSIPSIVLQILKKDKWGGYFLAIVIGLIGYLYIPSFTNDKARYYERYELFQGYSFGEFQNYIIVFNKADFIFDFLIYVFSRLNIPIEFFFLVLTSLCVILLLRIINDLLNSHYEKKEYSYLVVVSLVCLSFSLPALFSGIRFTLGSSVFMYGLSCSLLFGRKWRGILLILLATQIHFSLFLFTPILLLLNKKIYSEFPFRILLWISILFFFIPSGVVAQLFSVLSFSDSLSSKASLYTEQDDFISQNFDTNQGSYIMYLIRNAWYYLAMVILLLFSNKMKFDRNSDVMLKTLYFFTFLTNLTFSFPTVFSRYILVVKMLLVIYILYLYVFKGTSFIKQVLFLISLFYLASFIVDIYVFRYNFIVSLFQSNYIFIFNILTKKIEFNEFLK